MLTSLYGPNAVDKLAESRPIRRAAQITAYLFHRGKAASEETMDKLKDADVQQRVDSFTKTFSKEVQDGFKQLNDDINRQRKQK